MAKADEMKIILDNHKTFYAIAHHHHEEVERLVKERDAREIKTDVDADFDAEMNALIQRSAMVVVIFSALTLEAFINYYGIRKFSGGYFKDHLDKLSPISKWVVVPKLVLGKEINRDDQAFGSLRILFKLRDKLVHYKAKVKAIKDLKWDEDWVVEDHSRNAIRTVKLLLKDMKALDPSLNIDWLEEAEADIFA